MALAIVTCDKVLSLEVAVFCWREIIELLDDDKSGEISFDEFYAFGRKLERYVRENVDPHELLKEMFEIVDDDRR